MPAPTLLNGRGLVKEGIRGPGRGGGLRWAGNDLGLPQRRLGLGERRKALHRGEGGRAEVNRRRRERALPAAGCRYKVNDSVIGNGCPVPESGTGRYTFRGNVKTARLRSKSRRPLQGQRQLQRSRRDAGATNGDCNGDGNVNGNGNGAHRRWPLPFDPAPRDLRMNRPVGRFTESKAGIFLELSGCAGGICNESYAGPSNRLR